VIDFRYHLVSIVSIFLALAVGIVLGAGPLQEDLGTTLTEQTTQLRQDKAQLRSQLDAQARGVEGRDSFATAVGPSLTKAALQGRTLTLVVLPGTSSDLVRSMTERLTGAGASVGSSVTLTDGWSDPAKRSFRSDLAAQLAALVKAGTGTSNADQLPATVLARAILNGSDQSTNRLDPGSSQALEGLKAGDLLDFSPDQVTPASGAVLLGGAVEGSNNEETDARLSTYVQLARALDLAGSATLAVSAVDETDPRISSGVVQAIRADADTAKVVSTVDDADLPMGWVAAVLALAQQYSGTVGQYGLASDAKAVVPTVAATP